MITLSEKFLKKDNVVFSVSFARKFKKVSYFVCRRRNISILTPIFSTEFNSRETTGFLLQTVCLKKQ